MRPLEPPHTQPNFVMREMGYRVARKHARSCATWRCCWPFGAAGRLAAADAAAGFGPAVAGALLAVLSMAAGLVIERWLFFAEAEHVAMLYYGADAA